jgi:hypothetical protein
MNTKVKLLVGLFVLVAGVVVAFVLIGCAFEPLDPFARSDVEVKCPEGSTVTFYKKKVGWFTEQTQLTVRLADQRGKVIRTNSIGTFSHWVDSEMKVLETPEMFCDQKYWTRLSLQSRGIEPLLTGATQQIVEPERTKRASHSQDSDAARS